MKWALSVSRVDGAARTLLTLLAISLAFMGYEAVSGAYAQALNSEACFTCHSDKGLVRADADGKTVSLFVDAALFGKSVHGGLDCIACHTDIKELPHPERLRKVDCAACHEEPQAKFSGSLHYKALQAGKSNAPDCARCHGTHEILPKADPASPTHRANISSLCGRCHADLKFVVENVGEVGLKPFFAYQESVHGRAIARGDLKAATCSDCHESHEIRSPHDAQAKISKLNIPATCGQCHDQVKEQYTQSIHWGALTAGITRSPVCTDCHGIHSIRARVDENSPVAKQRIARTTCSQCHAGERLSDEYGVAAARVTTYLNSYHGLAMELGSTAVAHCASCHGVHNILPSSNPRSTIHPDRLETTCGGCHPGAAVKFSQVKIHRGITNDKTDGGARILYYVRYFYLWLIALVLGAMVLHNTLDFSRKTWGRRRPLDPPPPPGLA